MDKQQLTDLAILLALGGWAWLIVEIDYRRQMNKKGKK